MSWGDGGGLGLTGGVAAPSVRGSGVEGTLLTSPGNSAKSPAEDLPATLPLRVSDVRGICAM